MRDRAAIERDIASARARLLELDANRRHLEASTVAVRGRIAELEAELALLEPERNRMALVAPSSHHVFPFPVRVLRTECEVLEVLGGRHPCPEGCEGKHGLFPAAPLTVGPVSAPPDGKDGAA